MAIGKAKKGNNVTDKIMTTKIVAEESIEWISKYFLKGESFLDPCKGEGAFYNLLPDNKYWCEIDEGRDFFEWKEKVDWIVTNPPYSIYEEFLDHCIDIADNIALLVPLAKPFSSLGRLKKIKEYGGIHSIYVFPYSASKAGFPFGFPICVVYLKKNYRNKNIEFIYN